MREKRKRLRFSDSWKRSVARLVRVPLMQRLMVWGIRVTVPRHRIGVSLVVMDEEHRILMLKHVFHPYAPWGLPGGWMGRNETPQRCALRELKEEVDCSAHLGPVVHVTREQDMMGINLAFLADIVPGPFTLSSEILSAQWFAPDALPSPILTFTRDAIQSALAIKSTRNERYEGVVE